MRGCRPSDAPDVADAHPLGLEAGKGAPTHFVIADPAEPCGVPAEPYDRRRGVGGHPAAAFDEEMRDNFSISARQPLNVVDEVEHGHAHAGHTRAHLTAP